MPRTTRSIRSAARAFLAALLPAALLAAAPAEGARRFIIAFQGDAATLDPQGRNETTTISIQMHMFDTLVFRGIEGYEPGLATSWKAVSPTKWVIKLRQGVKFHDGSPFTAEVAKESLLRAQGKNFPKSQMKHFTKGIKSIRVADASTLEVDTGVPWPTLHEDLANIAIVPIDYIKKVGDAIFARKPVGTGPYKFVEWVKDDHIDLDAFPGYWGKQPTVKQVRIRPVPVDAARTAGLISGEIDVVWGVSPVDAKTLEKNPDVKVLRTITQRNIYLAFDHWRKEGGAFQKGGSRSPGLPAGAPNPFLKLKVRQAVAHAIDVPELIRSVMHGSGAPATHLAPPQAFGFNKKLSRLPYDPARAKKLLAEAGFPNGFQVRLDCSNDRYINDGPMCEAITGMLRKVGINATPSPRTKAVFFPALDNGDFSIYQAGWGTESVGPTFSAVFHTQDLKKGVGRINRGHYSNKEVDALIAQASSEMDDSKRQALWEKAWSISMGEIAVLPLYQQEAIIGVQKNVQLKPRFNEWILAQEITLAGRN
ncbi:MAG: ABC transporter substrate-binding protein [Candidatus Tectomicrobia bacterium]|uniref:ABC transporter substrate-binding protein n=1 Tax=Tectimicrobiota bacterium TaxID=2528274 RepID=A0A932HYS2_UNCTE|nr:ABC transporter substrate-binding protein [Candidatus Tectomicrobia bacterium]